MALLRPSVAATVNRLRSPLLLQARITSKTTAWLRETPAPHIQVFCGQVVSGTTHRRLKIDLENKKEAGFSYQSNNSHVAALVHVWD